MSVLYIQIRRNQITVRDLDIKKPRVNARGFFSFVFLLLPKSQKSSAFYAIFPQLSEAHNHLS